VIIYQDVILFDIFLSEVASCKIEVQKRYIDVVVFGKNDI